MSLKSHNNVNMFIFQGSWSRSRQIMYHARIQRQKNHGKWLSNNIFLPTFIDLINLLSLYGYVPFLLIFHQSWSIVVDQLNSVSGMPYNLFIYKIFCNLPYFDSACLHGAMIKIERYRCHHGKSGDGVKNRDVSR